MDEKIIQEQLNKLSPDYKSFVESDFTELTALAFAEDLDLNEQQVGVFENGLMLYLLFFLSKAQFAGFLTTECNIPARDAQLVVAAISSGLPPVVAAGLDQFEELLKNERAGAHDDTPAETQTPVDTNPETSTTPATTTPQDKQPTAEPTPVVTQPTTPPELTTQTPQTESVSAPESTTPDTPPEQVVKPIRTMKEDMDHVHGYGAYRKMFPDAEDDDEKVIQASSQDDVLSSKKTE